MQIERERGGERKGGERERESPTLGSFVFIEKRQFLFVCLFFYTDSFLFKCSFLLLLCSTCSTFQ